MRTEFNHAANDSPRSGSNKKIAPIVTGSSASGRTRFSGPFWRTSFAMEGRSSPASHSSATTSTRSTTTGEGPPA